MFWQSMSMGGIPKKTSAAAEFALYLVSIMLRQIVC